MKTMTGSKLPQYFRQILWSYDFEKIDAEKDARTIIINSINYGNLSHWGWIIKSYGKDRIRDVVNECRAGEVRAGAKRLIEIMIADYA